jgi:two-component system response regulator HydG
VLHLGDLPTQLQNFHLQHRRSLVVAAHVPSAGPAVRGPVLPLAQLEKEAILETLRKLNGDKLLAARLLGIGKTTLYRKLKEYGISAPDARNDVGNDAGKGAGDQAN